MSSRENKLLNATSPYLLQHATNPVHWQEWSPEVLDYAKAENKPLLISIGYAACHWCHVMAHESFEDEAVAELMNMHFVCIKIDREERPDLDHIYMEAAQMLTGRGGWPLNAFALPDGRPFYAATYFPKDNWKKVLANVGKAYSNSYTQLLETAEKLTEGLQLGQEFSPVEAQQAFKTKEYIDFLMSWQKSVDIEHGGFKGAPKFPMANSWQFLLQYYQLTDNHFAAEALLKTLDEIAFGGIYDHIGGGFSRYAVDDKWFAPHFEKMLYDNALLLSLYANVYKRFPKPHYKKVIAETIACMTRELKHPEAGFYSALDADSEGEEGKYYVWTYSELSALLSESELTLAEDYYNITRRGNWEASANILFTKQSPDRYAKDKGLDKVSFENDLEHLKQKLFQHRAKRIRPATDDKLLTSWNAMLVSGLVDAYKALQHKAHLDLAIYTTDFLLQTRLTQAKRLLRTQKNGKSISGFLDDYALMIEALINLYQVTFKIDYLHQAKALAETCFKEFKDEANTMFQYTSKNGEQLISTTYEINDKVIPSANSTLAKSLFLLGKFYNEDSYAETSKTMLNQMYSKLFKAGPYAANWQILFGWLAFPFYEVAIMGPEAKRVALELQSASISNSIFLGGHEEHLELLRHKLPADHTSTMIYVCENKTCQQPTSSVDVALQLLSA